MPPEMEMEMDPRIWSNLPDHLLERIVALLPLKTLLNLRTTCKHFHSLLLSPSFLSHTKPPSFSPFLLLSHPHFPDAFFLLHHVFLNRWRTLALPCSLPPRCAASAPTLLSASGGLLCFSLPNSFFVCNVLTISAKSIEFPTYPFESASLIPMSPASSSAAVHGYKLLVLCSSQSKNRVLVYDSGTEKWGQFDGYDPILTRNSHQEAVFFDGSLHFTTREPFSIVGFELDTGSWLGSTAELPQSLVFVRLVSSSGTGRKKDGNLYLVGGIGQDGISKRLKVWELKGGGGGEWAEVAVVPELICRKFGSVCYHNYEHVYCLWHEGSICICCYTWPEILVYQVGRKTWHWLPKCPLLPEKWSCGFRWFSYSPDLYALV